MRVAVTGAGGRLGSALVETLGNSTFVSEVLAWDLPDHDLDDPTSAGRLVGRYRPDVVVHCAAWTDVDGCARDPDLALRRNGTAVDEMARACAGSGAALVTISTNEVFDGRRGDGRPYRPDRPAQSRQSVRRRQAGRRGGRSGRIRGVGTPTSPPPQSPGTPPGPSRPWRSSEPPGSSAGPAAIFPARCSPQPRRRAPSTAASRSYPTRPATQRMPRTLRPG